MQKLYKFVWTGGFFVVFSCLFGVSCGNDRAEIDQLQTQTMALHDEAMKAMTEMKRKGGTLEKERATLDSLRTDTLRSKAILQVLAQMEKAEADMMTWMEQYTPPDQMPKAEALRYMQEQKKKMEQNLRDMEAWKRSGL
jgi:hypothetical protein